VDEEFRKGLNSFFLYYTAYKFIVFPSTSILAAMTAATITYAAANIENASAWIKVMIDATEEEKTAELARIVKAGQPAENLDVARTRYDTRVRCFLVSYGIHDPDTQDTLVANHTNYKFASSSSSDSD
jgi:hypothetical protein